MFPIFTLNSLQQFPLPQRLFTYFYRTASQKTNYLIPLFLKMLQVSWFSIKQLELQLWISSISLCVMWQVVEPHILWFWNIFLLFSTCEKMSVLRKYSFTRCTTIIFEYRCRISPNKKNQKINEAWSISLCNQCGHVWSRWGILCDVFFSRLCGYWFWSN